MFQVQNTSPSRDLQHGNMQVGIVPKPLTEFPGEPCVRGIQIIADRNNSKCCWIGRRAVTADSAIFTGGMPLPAKAQVSIPVDDPSGIYAVSTSGENNTQTVEVNATAGTFTLTLDDQTTGDVAFDASLEDVQAALEALSNIGNGNVIIYDHCIEFIGTLAGTVVSQLVADPTELGGLVDVATVQDGTALLNEIQSVMVYSFGGTFTLQLDDQISSPIEFNTTASDLQIILENLSNIGSGNVSVTVGPNGEYLIEFVNALAKTNMSQLVADPYGLTGSVDIATIKTGSVWQNCSWCGV